MSNTYFTKISAFAREFLLEIASKIDNIPPHRSVLYRESADDDESIPNEYDQSIFGNHNNLVIVMQRTAWRISQ